MILSCRKAAELISISRERPLRFWEQIRLRVHLWMCAYCTQYYRQMLVMRRIFAQFRSEETYTERMASWRLSQDARARILRQLAEYSHDTPSAGGQDPSTE